MVRTHIKQIIDAVIPDIEVSFHTSLPEQFSFQIEKTKNPAHGDFAVDVAFQLAKHIKRSPFDVATICCEHIQQRITKHTEWRQVIASVSVARPGFINFTVAAKAWGAIVQHIKESDENYGASSAGKGERVLLEYVSANPTGPLTIAHGRQASLGDTLANVMHKAGYEVFREYYVNDTGRQIVLLGESTRARYLELLGVECALPADGYQGEYIRDIARAIIVEVGDKYEKKHDAKTTSFFIQYAVNYLMKKIKEDLSVIGVTFDEYFSEQSLRGRKIKQVLTLLKKRGHLYEKENALWFASTEFGDDKDRVLRKSDGEFTYLVPDIAYHREKLERGYTRIINLLGPDHHGYVKRLKAAVAALGYDPRVLEILIVQLTTLYKQGEPLRMSTRSGTFISLRELIDEVGPDATRFFFLMRRINSHLDFDLELAKEKSQDNPVFYLQYAHARIASIIKFAERKIKTDANVALLKEQDEIDLIKLLHELPYQVAQTARSLEPYRLVDYLKDVAVCFHRFYTNQRVVTSNAALTQARLLLCDAARIVIRNGLELLGVSHPNQM